MARPSIQRAVVRLPASSSKTQARLEFPDGRSIALDDPEYDTYIATFSPFALPLSGGGQALVIPEKRGRGGRYWVARAYERGVREAVYIGAKPDADSLRRAQTELSGRLHAHAVSAGLLGLAQVGSSEAAGSDAGSPASQAALDLLAAWERFQEASAVDGGPSEEELLASAADVLRGIRASRP